MAMGSTLSSEGGCKGWCPTRNGDEIGFTLDPTSCAESKKYNSCISKREESQRTTIVSDLTTKGTCSDSQVTSRRERTHKKAKKVPSLQETLLKGDLMVKKNDHLFSHNTVVTGGSSNSFHREGQIPHRPLDEFPRVKESEVEEEEYGGHTAHGDDEIPLLFSIEVLSMAHRAQECGPLVSPMGTGENKTEQSFSHFRKTSRRRRKLGSSFTQSERREIFEREVGMSEGKKREGKNGSGNRVSDFFLYSQRQGNRKEEGEERMGAQSPGSSLSVLPCMGSHSSSLRSGSFHSCPPLYSHNMECNELLFTRSPRSASLMTKAMPCAKHHRSRRERKGQGERTRNGVGEGEEEEDHHHRENTGYHQIRRVSLISNPCSPSTIESRGSPSHSYDASSSCSRREDEDWTGSGSPSPGPGEASLPDHSSSIPASSRSTPSESSSLSSPLRTSLPHSSFCSRSSILSGDCVTFNEHDSEREEVHMAKAYRSGKQGRRRRGRRREERRGEDAGEEKEEERLGDHVMDKKRNKRKQIGEEDVRSCDSGSVSIDQKKFSSPGSLSSHPRSTASSAGTGAPFFPSRRFSCSSSGSPVRSTRGSIFCHSESPLDEQRGRGGIPLCEREEEREEVEGQEEGLSEVRSTLGPKDMRELEYSFGIREHEKKQAPECLHPSLFLTERGEEERKELVSSPEACSSFCGSHLHVRPTSLSTSLEAPQEVFPPTDSLLVKTPRSTSHVEGEGNEKCEVGKNGNQLTIDTTTLAPLSVPSPSWSARRRRRNPSGGVLTSCGSPCFEDGIGGLGGRGASYPFTQKVLWLEDIFPDLPPRMILQRERVFVPDKERKAQHLGKGEFGDVMLGELYPPIEGTDLLSFATPDTLCLDGGRFPRGESFGRITPGSEGAERGGGTVRVGRWEGSAGVCMDGEEQRSGSREYRRLEHSQSSSLQILIPTEVLRDGVVSSADFLRCGAATKCDMVQSPTMKFNEGDEVQQSSGDEIDYEEEDDDEDDEEEEEEEEEDGKSKKNEGKKVKGGEEMEDKEIERRSSSFPSCVSSTSVTSGVRKNVFSSFVVSPTPPPPSGRSENGGRTTTPTSIGMLFSPFVDHQLPRHSSLFDLSTTQEVPVHQQPYTESSKIFYHSGVSQNAGALLNQSLSAGFLEVGSYRFVGSSGGCRPDGGSRTSSFWERDEMEGRTNVRRECSQKEEKVEGETFECLSMKRGTDVEEGEEAVREEEKRQWIGLKDEREGFCPPSGEEVEKFTPVGMMMMMGDLIPQPQPPTSFFSKDGSPSEGMGRETSLRRPGPLPSSLLSPGGLEQKEQRHSYGLPSSPSPPCGGTSTAPVTPTAKTTTTTTTCKTPPLLIKGPLLNCSQRTAVVGGVGISGVVGSGSGGQKDEGGSRMELNRKKMSPLNLVHGCPCMQFVSRGEESAVKTGEGIERSLSLEGSSRLMSSLNHSQLSTISIPQSLERKPSKRRPCCILPVQSAGCGVKREWLSSNTRVLTEHTHMTDSFEEKSSTFHDLTSINSHQDDVVQRGSDAKADDQENKNEEAGGGGEVRAGSEALLSHLGEEEKGGRKSISGILSNYSSSSSISSYGTSQRVSNSSQRYDPNSDFIWMKSMDITGKWIGKEGGGGSIWPCTFSTPKISVMENERTISPKVHLPPFHSSLLDIAPSTTTPHGTTTTTPATASTPGSTFPSLGVHHAAYMMTPTLGTSPATTPTSYGRCSSLKSSTLDSDESLWTAHTGGSRSGAEYGLSTSTTSTQTLTTFPSLATCVSRKLLTLKKSEPISGFPQRSSSDGSGLITTLPPAGSTPYIQTSTTSTCPGVGPEISPTISLTSSDHQPWYGGVSNSSFATATSFCVSSSTPDPSYPLQKTHIRMGDSRDGGDADSRCVMRGGKPEEGRKKDQESSEGKETPLLGIRERGKETTTFSSLEKAPISPLDHLSLPRTKGYENFSGSTHEDGEEEKEGKEVIANTFREALMGVETGGEGELEGNVSITTDNPFIEKDVPCMEVRKEESVSRSMEGEKSLRKAEMEETDNEIELGYCGEGTLESLTIRDGKRAEMGKEHGERMREESKSSTERREISLKEKKEEPFMIEVAVPFRSVAVKHVSKTDLFRNEHWNALMSEITMASHLFHKGLVNWFGVCEDEKDILLVMDLVENGNLLEYIEKFGVPHAREMAPRFMADIVLALEYLQDGEKHPYFPKARYGGRGECQNPNVNFFSQVSAENSCSETLQSPPSGVSPFSWKNPGHFSNFQTTTEGSSNEPVEGKSTFFSEGYHTGPADGVDKMIDGGGPLGSYGVGQETGGREDHPDVGCAGPCRYNTFSAAGRSPPSLHWGFQGVGVGVGGGGGESRRTPLCVPGSDGLPSPVPNNVRTPTLQFRNRTSSFCSNVGGWGNSSRSPMVSGTSPMCWGRNTPTLSNASSSRSRGGDGKNGGIAVGSWREGCDGGGRGSSKTTSPPVLDPVQGGVVLHRDLKPENLLLTWDYHVKIGDFGSACFLGDQSSNKFAGSPQYISPEMVTNSKAEKSSDLWALGCILFYLVEGRSPFAEKTSYLSMQKIKFFNSSSLTFGKEVSPEAADLIHQLLQSSPEDRIGSDKRGGFAELKKHPFFFGIVWETVLDESNLTTTNTTSDISRLTQDRLLPNEAIAHHGLVVPLDDQRFKKPVVLVLTNKPRLFLVEDETNEYLLEVPFTRHMSVEVTCAETFCVKGSGNVLYRFRDEQRRADIWADRIAGLQKRSRNAEKKVNGKRNLRKKEKQKDCGSED